MKREPREAQSELTVHGFEQDFANVVHPASVNVPRPRHESPAAHSESEVHRVPADLSAGLPHASKGSSSEKSKGTSRMLRIVLIVASACRFDHRPGAPGEGVLASSREGVP
jgi:hypothetical protein